MLLMEAADDIAYCMSDLEDGLEKRIIRPSDLKSAFGDDMFPEGTIEPFIAFKTKVVTGAVETVAETFTSNLGPILDGETVELLPPGSSIGQLLSKVKGFARSEIYSHKSAEQIELAGRSVILGILEHFAPLLKLSLDDFLAVLQNDGKVIRSRDLDLHQRLMRRLPQSYRDKYSAESRGPEILRRSQLVSDFVSGMTDDFALDTYQLLQGIKIQ
jgi:dGTPase